jgi:hypothetical protein
MISGGRSYRRMEQVLLNDEVRVVWVAAMKRTDLRSFPRTEMWARMAMSG